MIVNQWLLSVYVYSWLLVFNQWSSWSIHDYWLFNPDCWWFDQWLLMVHPWLLMIHQCFKKTTIGISLDGHYVLEFWHMCSFSRSCWSLILNFISFSSIATCSGKFTVTIQSCTPWHWGWCFWFCKKMHSRHEGAIIFVPRRQEACKIGSQDQRQALQISLGWSALTHASKHKKQISVIGFFHIAKPQPDAQRYMTGFGGCVY